MPVLIAVLSGEGAVNAVANIAATFVVSVEIA